MAIILYVDTDQLYMSTMKLLLEKHNFKVLLARSRDHLKQVLLANAVDVVLVDQDFAREFPQTISDVRSLSPVSRTVLLGMRHSDNSRDSADAYYARLDGPDKLIELLQSGNTPGLRKSAHPA